MFSPQKTTPHSVPRGNEIAREPHRSGRHGRRHDNPGHQGVKPENTCRERTPHRKSRSASHAPGEQRNGRLNEKNVHIPPPARDTVRIIPLGGVEEIGKNMVAVEFQDDILIVDCGFQFREEDTPGIDYILPNTGYLEAHKEKIRGMLITHGHLDHIGGIPYVLEKVGNPPIYSRLLTTVMIEKRQTEFPHLPPANIKVVDRGETITLGKLKVRFFAVTHTIPDSMGVIIETPYGDVVHTGDLKLDHVNGIPTEAEEQEFAVFKNRNVLCLLQDSTNAERPGFSIPEYVVHENIEKIIKDITGRLIIGTFSSQLERIIKIIEVSEKYGKKVVVEGRSMRQNIEIVQQLKMLVVKNGTIISVSEMDAYPIDRIVVLATGAQGDEFAALMRMANRTNKYIKINKHDTILLSSSIVPGNERAVQKLKDNLSRQGARIIHKETMDVHASGHANRDETLWIHSHIKPKFFIPVHGYHYMLRVHGDIAAAAGVPEKNIVIPDNGMIIDIEEGGTRITIRKERAPSGVVLVDGFSIGDVQEVVLRDRQMLAEDGMFVIIASINPRTGKLRKSPDIISRGFIYLRDSQQLLNETRIIIKKTIEDLAHNMQPINFEYIKGAVTDAVGRFLFQKTNKRPMVIPVLIGV